MNKFIVSFTLVASIIAAIFVYGLFERQERNYQQLLDNRIVVVDSKSFLEMKAKQDSCVQEAIVIIMAGIVWNEHPSYRRVLKDYLQYYCDFPLKESNHIYFGND